MKKQKQALLIGINYEGTDAELSGCVNDVRNVKQVLLDKYGYQENEIIMMTDDPESDDLQPTKNNILIQMINLISASTECHEIWFHYSGHGSYVPDSSGDEDDGYDEVIVPVDYDQSGLVTDDLIRAVLDRLEPACRCLVVFDCCHSGTLADLPYVYRDNRSSSGQEPENTPDKTPADVLMISGCKDDQTSADAMIQEEWAGAMTHHLLEVLEDYDYTIQLKKLISRLRVKLKNGGYTQYPVLSSSKPINLYRFFSINQNDPPMISK